MQLACTINTKQQNAASSFLRHRRKKYVGSIHSKLCMDCYQTAADCVLIKTQPQPRKQINSLSPLLKPLFDHPTPPHMP